MDPCSQGLIGASLACSKAKKKDLKSAFFFGFIGGVSADLDILIRSANDSLLFIEYHRHFSHSLFFVPFGALLVTMFLYIFFKNKQSFKNIYLFVTLGFLTHGLLDACTSYGTNIFWPFSEKRVSLNIISIIDPIYTSVLLIFLIAGILTKSTKYVSFGILISVLYLFLGFFQKNRVDQSIQNVAEERNHIISRKLFNPTIGNNILWRSIYQSNNYYYVDAVYAPLFGKIKIKDGVRLKVIDKEKVFPELGKNSIQREDIRRFSFFSQDFIFIHPDYNNIIADLRYGTLPYDYKSLWGIEVDPKNENQHVKYKNLRNFNSDVYKEFWLLIKGKF